MVYQLHDRGLLHSIDEPLNTFCPHFHINNPFTTDNITVRQIISSVSVQMVTHGCFSMALMFAHVLTTFIAIAK